MQTLLQNLQVKSVYEGHRVKVNLVKVTGKGVSVCPVRGGGLLWMERQSCCHTHMKLTELNKLKLCSSQFH